MFALVDCNNFFVSCERVFNPKLIGKPVVVLSNNDGCIISRSNEAKELGIKMGEPYFLAKQRFGKKFIALSSNYELYGNLSHRVMSILEEQCPLIERYSIDEAFLQLDNIPSVELEQFACQLRKVIFQRTGLPVSIGIAKTKVLSKLANHVAKKFPSLGVKCLLEKNDINKWLNQFPVDEVWGVGWRLKNKLIALGITTAKKLQEASPAEMQRRFNILLAQLVHELNERPCFTLQKEKPKKSITYSRSFGELLASFEQVKEALIYFVMRAAEKLRQQNDEARQVLIFLKTNRHRRDLAQKYIKSVIDLPYATADSRILVKHVISGLEKLWREGYWYNKAGIILLNLTKHENGELDLGEKESIKSKNLMQAIDSINQRYGKEALFLAVQGNTEKKWQGKRKILSNNAAGNLDELIKVS